MKREIITGIFGLLLAFNTYGIQGGVLTGNNDLTDMDSIAYIEDHVPVELGFNTADYLPADFDPYAVPNNFLDISYIEEESVPVIGFDTSLYLPEAFDAYKEYFDLDSIEYIEEEEEIIFNFNIEDYLPQGFNPAVAF